MSEPVWFYVEGETQLGPVTKEELTTLLRQRLPRETLVWREGMPDWVAAPEIGELGVRLSPPPPPPAPPPRVAAPARPAVRRSAPLLDAGAQRDEPPSYNPFVLWKRCFAWGGRFDRAEFAIAYFGQMAVLFVLFLFLGVVGALLTGANPSGQETNSMLIGAAALLILPISVVVGLGAAVRRLHDLGQSGWLALLLLLPCLNFLFAIYLAAAPGTAQPAATGASNMPMILIGVVVGIFALVVIAGIVSAIAIPSLLRARLSANEAMAIGDVRTVISAEAAYSSANGGFYGSITCLATPSGCIAGYSGPPFLDSALAQPQVIKNGYERRWFETPSRTRPGALENYCYSATPAQPNQTGIRSFGADASSTIFFSPLGTPCCSERGLDTSSCQPLP